MQRKSFTILVAQDDPDEQVIFKAALEETGYHGECRFVDNRKEFFGYLSRVQDCDKEFELPGLIVLDLRHMLKILKSRPCLARIPVVFLAPTSMDANEMQADFDLDVDAIVMKPMAYKDFVIALRSGLESFCREMIKAETTDEPPMT